MPCRVLLCLIEGERRHLLRKWMALTADRHPQIEPLLHV